MINFLFLIIFALAVAIIQLSFLANLPIFGAVINLPLVIIIYRFYHLETKKRLKVAFYSAFLIGFCIDLLSGGYFLSETIVLLLIILSLWAINRLISFDSQSPLIYLFTALLSIIFDALYLLFNRTINFSSNFWSTALLNALFTTLALVIIQIIAKRFIRPRGPAEIKISGF